MSKIYRVLTAFTFASVCSCGSQLDEDITTRAQPLFGGEVDETTQGVASSSFSRASSMLL